MQNKGRKTLKTECRTKFSMKYQQLYLGRISKYKHGLLFIGNTKNVRQKNTWDLSFSDSVSFTSTRQISEGGKILSN